MSIGDSIFWNNTQLGFSRNELFYMRFFLYGTIDPYFTRML